MFKYFGSKQRIAHRYPAPVHDRIVEPFAGAGAYAVHHRRVPEVLLIEKDRKIVDLWHRLLSMDAADILRLERPTPGDRSTEILLLLAAGRTTRDTPDELVVSSRMAARIDPMLRRIASVVDECRHFQVVEGDYQDAPEIKATWFVDPPYTNPLGGRWDRSRGGRYAYSYRGIDYSVLAEWCRNRAGQTIVCEMDGATWMPWNGIIETRDGSHRQSREVYWHNERKPECRT